MFMASIEVKVGQRVRLRMDVDRFPHFVATAGMTGTVTICDGEQVAVRLDEALAGCEDLENQIYWCENDEQCDLAVDLPKDLEVTG
jgi:hypothetical protein